MSLVILRRRISDLKPSFDDLLSSDYRNHPRYRGVVGHWILNESGGVTAYDISGNGNHGTLTNGPTWTQGQFGPALSFDGSDDFVDLGGSATLRPASITVAAWVKSDGTQVNLAGIVVGRKDSGTNGGWLLVATNTNTIRFYIWDSGTSGWKLAESDAAISDGVWTHLVGTYTNGGTVSLYVNGSVQAITATATSIDYGTPASNDQLGKYFTLEWLGSIDDVRIYNRALAADEIRSLYLDGFLEFRQLDVYRWIRRAPAISIIPVLTTPPVYRPTLVGVRTI